MIRKTNSQLGIRDREDINSKCIMFVAPGQVQMSCHIVPFPKKGQLRIRVVACGICQREIYVLRGMLHREFPTVMGHEPVGIVEAVGSGVDTFRVGQWVTGIGVASLSEYDVVEACFMAPLMDSPTRPEYWLGEPVMCVINAVNRPLWVDKPIVVVCGAGFMGNLLIQALRLKKNPSKLVAIDINQRRLNLALEAGADEAIMNNSDVKKILKVLGQPADVIYEVSGVSGTVSLCTALLRNGGTLCLFAHHFSVESDVVSQWHLRGITVLNTVPWSAPNLELEIREAIQELCRGNLRMNHLIERTITFSDAPNALTTMIQQTRYDGKSAVIVPLR